MKSIEVTKFLELLNPDITDNEEEFLEVFECDKSTFREMLSWLDKKPYNPIIKIKPVTKPKIDINERYELCKKRCAEIGVDFVRAIDRNTIELKCHCGHVWQPRISNFLGRLKTGCKMCAKRGYRASIPGTFYVVKWTHPETNKSHLKYGISNTPKSRLRIQSKLTEYVPTVLFDCEFKDGSIPWQLESICDEHSKELYGKEYVVTKEEFPDGYTETMGLDQYNWLNELVFENSMTRLKPLN